ncbi:MAG: MaoC family dehydratase [Candidatus Elarobacter sp.]
MTVRYLEDFPVGAEAEFGSVVVDEGEVRAFAERYDPQPFHTDPEAATRSPYGGLIASGWHTGSMMMRLVVDHFIDAETSLGSPGLGPIHWKLPVRPGDTLRVRARILENRRSTSKPDRGLITFTCDVLNQRDEIVMTVEHWVGIMRARPDGNATTSPSRGEQVGSQRG